MPLSLFDLHADTVWAMYRTKEPLGSNSLAVSLEKAMEVYYGSALEVTETGFCLK